MPTDVNNYQGSFLRGIPYLGSIYLFSPNMMSCLFK